MISPVRPKTAAPIKGSSSEKKEETPVKNVAAKAMKNLSESTSNKKSKSVWSRIKGGFKKFFTCWCNCFKSKHENSSNPSGTTHEISSFTDPVPQGDIFEALNWIKPAAKPKAATKAAPKPVIDWRNKYPDYQPRDLIKDGLALEDIHQCPPLNLKASKDPLATSDKEHATHNPIYFKNFPEFNVSIVHQDLFESEAEVMVNSANTHLGGGGGIDGAIHKAGGQSYAREHWNLKRHYDAKYTPGYAAMIQDVKLNSPKWDEKGKKTKNVLKSTKDIIVVAGPSGNNPTAKNNNVLFSCVLNSLILADLHGKTSIALPAISTGIFGYPKGVAAEVSLLAIMAFMQLPNTQLRTIDIHSFDPTSPSQKGDRIDLMFYQDAVNCYPDMMTTEEAIA